MYKGFRIGKWAASAALLGGLLGVAAQAAPECPPAGAWTTPGGERLEATALFDELASSDVVLLGERHDRADHHRWQLGTLAGLLGRRPDLVIGLEMLPRSKQPVLDAWVAGELDPETFIEASGWYRHWGFDPRLYWPILHFARVHDIPLLALNLEREAIQRLGQDGWDALDAEDRDAVSAPAAASAGYREYLESVLEGHPGSARLDTERFVATQLAWDRMMAGAIADRLKRNTEDPPLIAALMGAGHLEYGYGVPHQLADLGVSDARVLLPRTPGKCATSDPALADAVFGVRSDERFEWSPPRLGVRIEDGTKPGIRIAAVQEGSVGEAAGLETGDRILEAGERPVYEVSDLQRVVQAVTPGTWLPLQIERDGKRREQVARFPRE